MNKRIVRSPARVDPAFQRMARRAAQEVLKNEKSKKAVMAEFNKGHSVEKP